jgi:hypothetical protein
MYWNLTVEEQGVEASAVPPSWDGRFVLQRHHDTVGPHLDLRLEQEGYLLGWRVEGCALSGQCWATEKTPHPPHWLECDGESVREDSGVYAWLDRDADGGLLLLSGARTGLRGIRVRREPGLPISAVRSVAAALAVCGAEPADAGALIGDGVAARRRAIGRLCGLARELDGSAFDEEVTRKTLKSLTLEEIHAQLRAYEVRFDQKYPPQPVSRPERLPGEQGEDRADAAMAIVRSGW